MDTLQSYLIKTIHFKINFLQLQLKTLVLKMPYIFQIKTYYKIMIDF